MPIPRLQYGFCPGNLIQFVVLVLMCALGKARAGVLPLHTAHHWIVDAKGHRVKLAGVNWYGADNVEF
jgi:hypothetical protein